MDSGKSTLTGVLSKNVLDNGRGSARSLILKHIHEQKSGRTSCISQHHIKYTDENQDLKSIVSLVDLAGHEIFKNNNNGYEKMFSRLCRNCYSC